MSEGPLNIAIIGVSGRLGRAIARQLLLRNDLRITGGVVSAQSANKGADIGELAGVGFKGVETVVRLEDAIAGAQIVIDASQPAVSIAVAERLAEQGGPCYITGTTGWTPEQEDRLLKVSQKIPVLVASNFSLGLAVLEHLMARAAQLLDTHDYDLEIIETHHRAKIDAPSGTALSLGNAAAKVREASLSLAMVTDRANQSTRRETGDIGFSSVRGGGVVGEHEARFMSDHEEISIGHRAFDRSVFAHGAIEAARWIVDKPAGLYSMQDVIAR